MIWEILLAVKGAVDNCSSSSEFISIKISNNYPEVCFDTKYEEESLVIDFKGEKFNAASHIVVDGPFSVKLMTNKMFGEEDASLLTSYLSYALIPYFSRKYNKCYAIAHFAQTLDGRIASSTGDSKWIGNDENLVHAHKMRALCDAILVGARTLHVDNPRLNVRLVKGTDPAKVIVGGADLDLGDYQAIDQDTMIFMNNHSNHNVDLRQLSLDRDQDQYRPKDLLNALYQKGINSVYIEGGSYTTSLFLKHNAIDQVQVHITPKIIGSGLIGFQFEGLNSIGEAIEFSCYRFIPIGDHMMFIGELNIDKL